MKPSTTPAIDIHVHLVVATRYFLVAATFILFSSCSYYNKNKPYSLSEDGVDTVAIKVPPLIIQPYVENAILHIVLPDGQVGGTEVLLTIPVVV